MANNKVKIKFAGINDRCNACYITEKGTYIEYIENDGFYKLNQYPEGGFIGINGETDYKIKSDSLEIVDSF